MSSRRKTSLVGERFGKLVVASLDEARSSQKHSYFRCECDCGKSCSVRRNELTGRQRQCCGCTTGRTVDMVGKRCGRLLVVEASGKNKNGTVLWRCVCDCGREAVVMGTLLRRGDTTSCGCAHAEATSKKNTKCLVGQKHGKLTVTQRASAVGQRVKWRCLCECGREAVVAASNLKSGNTRSCGCENHKRGPESPSWDPSILPEERGKRREKHAKQYAEWRTAVMSRDNYTCVCCGVRGGILCAHHLDGWKWCREGRYRIDNGVTLCDHPGGCHKQFHRRFGRGRNTRQQFTQFLGDAKPPHGQTA